MNQYEKEMEEFCQVTSLLDFVKCFHDLYRQGIPKDSQKLEVKISSKRSKLKLVHLNRLASDCVTTFSIPKICGLILKSVTLGCFLVTWLVPAHYSKLLRWKLSICHKMFFEDHDIQCVTLDKEVCYQKGSVRAPINPAHEVISDTTITEEVFELRNMMKVVMRSSPPFTMTQLCTAYVYKILSQHISSQGERIILRSLAKLPQTVRKKFSALCKEAYKRTTQDLNAVSTFSMSKDGLGFTSCIQSSRQVFLHRTLQQYLAALYVVNADSSKVLEEITTRVEQAQHSYFYYFIAGLSGDKKWIYDALLKSFQHHLNMYILLFEVGNPLITSHNLEQVEVIDAQTQSGLLTTVQNLFTNIVPSLQNLTDFKFTEWDAFLRDSLQSRAVAMSYTMYIVGYMLCFGSGVWQLQQHWDLPIVEKITRGLIAALENTCKCEGEFPHKDLKVNIEVSSNTLDMEYFMNMPLCILEKIRTLKLSSNNFQELTTTSSTINLVSEFAIFVSDLFGRDYHIEEFELNTKCFDSESLDTIMGGLHDSKHLRSLKFCGDLTVDHLISLYENLKKNDSTIVELYFDQCGLEEEGTFQLAKMLMKNTSLKVLSITGKNNAIGSISEFAIAKALQINNHLKTLDLRSVQLSSEGACSVGEMLSVNQSLQTLCLDHTNIDDEGAIWLVDGLTANKTLRELGLYHCGTSDSFDSDPLVNALKSGNVSTSSRVSFNSQQGVSQDDQFF